MMALCFSFTRATATENSFWFSDGEVATCSSHEIASAPPSFRRASRTSSGKTFLPSAFEIASAMTSAASPNQALSRCSSLGRPTYATKVTNTPYRTERTIPRRNQPPKRIRFSCGLTSVVKRARLLLPRVAFDHVVSCHVTPQRAYLCYAIACASSLPRLEETLAHRGLRAERCRTARKAMRLTASLELAVVRCQGLGSWPRGKSRVS